MPAPTRYLDELREHATRLVVEARRDPASTPGAIRRIAEQFGDHPEALPTWVAKAETDAGERRARPAATPSASPPWNGRIVSCARPIRS